MGGRGEYWLPCPALNCIELNWVPEWVVLQGFVMLGFQDIFSLWGNLKTKCRMDGNIIWTIQTLSFFTKLYKHMILKHDFNTCFFFLLNYNMQKQQQSGRHFYFWNSCYINGVYWWCSTLLLISLCLWTYRMNTRRRENEDRVYNIFYISNF